MNIPLCFVSCVILSVGALNVPKNGKHKIWIMMLMYTLIFTPVFMNFRNNPIEPQRIIKGNNESLRMTNFQRRKAVKILVHGWNGVPESPEFKDAFLADSDSNVILVNWTAGSSGAESPALLNAPGVGRYIAAFIDWLSAFGPVYRNIHLVGDGLGAHIVGYTGRNCKKGHIKYITACDPTKNTFETSEDKINRADARYVEVIHTNTANLGLLSPTGHTDFYPNGGKKMPGCPDTPDEGVCSHTKAFEYFVESINRLSFKGKECVNFDELVKGRCTNLSQLHMGGVKPKKRTGVYLVETNTQKPYSKE